MGERETTIGMSRRDVLRLAGIGAAAIVAACAPATSSGASPSPAASADAAAAFKVDLAAAKAEGKVVGYGVLIDSQWAALKDTVARRAGLCSEHRQLMPYICAQRF